MRNLRPHCGASPASSDPAFVPRDRVADVGGSMDDDFALHTVVVDALLQALQPQRQTVLPDVGVAREECSEAAHEAVGGVREPHCLIIAAVLPMGRQFLEQDARVYEIEYPHAPLGGGLGVVNNREYIRPNFRASRLQALQCRQSSFQCSWVKSRRQLPQSEELRAEGLYRHGCGMEANRVCS